MTGPLAQLLVPPDVGFHIAPWLAGRIRRRPVVEHPAVGGPGPGPFRGDPALLTLRLAPCRLIDAAGVAAGVDPATAGGRAVRLEFGETVEQGAVRAAAIDLTQHCLGVGFGVLADLWVLPGKVLQQPIPLRR